MTSSSRDPSLRETLTAGWRELALYLAGGVVYIAVGVAFPELLFSWFVATAYLLLCVAALPALVEEEGLAHEG